MEMRKHKVRDILNRAACIAILIAVSACLSSCTPTYPKEKLPEAIKEVFKDEYDMDVDVAVKGSTLGIYHPMNGLLDVTLGISKDAWDQISNLILVASRVTLSTDADIKFYCVITQDERLPELQVVIIKYVDDVKKGMYQNIGRSESFKRTLFSINLTPQARKERSVEKVFDKLGLAEESRENVLNEFFRSTPTELSDMGYWRGHFYLKDITLEEFLVAQIANRIKIDFREDEEEKKTGEPYKYQSSEGYFSNVSGERIFIVKFKILDQERSLPGKEDPRVAKIKKIMEIANTVVTGYKFRDFDLFEMDDQIENIKLWASSAEVYNFNDITLPLEDVIRTSGEYFGTNS